MRNVALDFECSGLDYWHPDFRVTDCAFSWRNDTGKMVSKHVRGHEEVREALLVLVERDVRIIVHNLNYELGVLMTQYPEIRFKEMWCTQRLCQVGDAGSEQKFYKKRYKKQGGEPRDGLNLEACCSRWLSNKYHDHKREAHNWILEKFGPGAKVGTLLSQLPSDIMQRYNCGDTENTLRLYEEVVAQFSKDRYKSYTLDHQLYRGRCLELVNAFVLGVKINPEQLQTCINVTTKELDGIREKFFAAHKDDILQAIAIKVIAFCEDPTLKKESGRHNRWMKVLNGEEFGDRKKICGFNINSPKDLYLLYNGVLGIDAPFMTQPDKNGKGGGNPSFKKAHLPAWHDSGKILQDKGTLGIVKKQAESLQILSSRDGRWHLSTLATGTKSGRMSGRSNDGT